MRMIAERRTTIMGAPAAAHPTFQWYLVVGMFVVLFVGDLLSQGIGPDVVLLVIQMGMLLGAVAQSMHYRVPLRLPGLVPLMLLLAVVFVSAITNEQGVAETVVFVRAMLGQYVVLVALLGLRFTAEEYKKLNWAIFAMCAVQIPTAAFRLMTLTEERAYLAGGGTNTTFGSEAASGTMAFAAGSLGTTFPLMVIGFLYAFYLWQKKRIYLLWIVGFMFFSLCVGKRAFMLILPIYILGLDFIIRQKARLRGELGLLWVVIVLGLFAAMTLHPSLNSEHKVGGEIDFQHLFNYVKSYTTGVTKEGSSGRYSTSRLFIVDATEKGVTTVLLGNGPATLIKSGLIDSNFKEAMQDFGIRYGITGAGWIFAQIGLLGLVCYLWFVVHFFWQAIRIHRREQIPYWRAICGGLIGAHLVFFIDVCIYSLDFATGKLLPALFFLFLAQVLSRKDLYAKKLRGMPPKVVPPVMRPWPG